MSFLHEAHKLLA